MRPAGEIRGPPAARSPTAARKYNDRPLVALVLVIALNLALYLMRLEFSGALDDDHPLGQRMTWGEPQTFKTIAAETMPRTAPLDTAKPQLGQRQQQERQQEQEEQLFQQQLLQQQQQAQQHPQQQQWQPRQQQQPESSPRPPMYGESATSSLVP